MATKTELQDWIEPMKSFFGGRYYPPLVCLLVLLGYFTGAEMFFGSLNLLLFCFSLWITDSAKHALIVGSTFLYQISPGHAPTVPARSDYFFAQGRPIWIAILLVALLVSLVAYVVRTETYRKLTFSECPLLLPMLVLAAAFITNGIFSPKHTAKDLLLGVAEAFAYFFFFLLFYFGFRERDLDGIDGYFCYTTLWIAAVVLLQLGHLYLTGDVFREDGAINVGKIVLGWGVSTVIGAALTVLIPILLYGAMRRRYPIPYFVMAFLVLIASFCTMSRTALGVSALFFAICMLIGCFYGERKTLFQVAAIVMMLCVIAVLIGYFEDIRTLFAVYFEKGFSSTGRLALWKKCVDGFFEHPLFGAGFFGLELGEAVSNFAHNTILQMLGACGLFGIVAYLLYRIETVFLYFKRPSLFKTMLGVGAATIVVASLLDIFLFSFFSMIYHSALLALTCLINRVEDNESADRFLRTLPKTSS